MKGETDVGDVKLSTTTCCSTTSHVTVAAGAALKAASHASTKVASVWWSGESRFSFAILIEYQWILIG